MKRYPEITIAALFLGVYVLGTFIGYRWGASNTEKTAARHGAAHYITGPGGEPKFVWGAKK